MNTGRHIRTLSVFMVAMVSFILSAAAPEGWAAQIPLEIAKIIFEFNSSGPDLGIQVSLDGDPWHQIKIVDPKGHTMLEIEAKGRLKKFGLTELFAESKSRTSLRTSQLKKFSIASRRGYISSLARQLRGTN
jgi:hypothetical protein